MVADAGESWHQAETGLVAGVCLGADVMADESAVVIFQAKSGAVVV